MRSARSRLARSDKLRSWKDGVVSRLTGGLAGLAKPRKVTTTRGYGRFTSPHRMHVELARGDHDSRLRAGDHRSRIRPAGAAVYLAERPAGRRLHRCAATRRSGAAAARAGRRNHRAGDGDRLPRARREGHGRRTDGPAHHWGRQGSGHPANLYLASLRDRNEVLFYRLFTDHIEEMLPIVYTPTVGMAIERFSHEFGRPRGVYLSVDHPHQVETAFRYYGMGPDDVDLIVATDSEGILGIGDWGVGGIEIAIGKLAVYIAAAGIHPRRVIPVVLDAGTDNLALLNDDMYLGNRHARIRDDRYDELIEAYVTAATTLFPHAMLHWEDFGTGNARRILTKYADACCTFNDDMQGTAAVVLAAVFGALRAAGTRMRDQRVVIHGAGTAGTGIADALREVMIRDGLSPSEATERFYAIGSRGLLTDEHPGRLRDFQRPYARPAAEIAAWSRAGSGPVGLADVVANSHPTILIGTSTQPAAFSESIVTDMAAHVQRPIIMPLSNPTSRCEALPADLIRWTDGRALVATGSPFGPVRHNGRDYQIAQANNALIFPGLGLGVTLSRARRISDGMLSAAAAAAAGLCDATSPGAALLPPVKSLRAVSAAVAVAVAVAAQAEGLAETLLDHPVEQVHEAMWKPIYPRIELI